MILKILNKIKKKYLNKIDYLTKTYFNKGVIIYPNNLLTYLRFDITAKTLYARHRIKKVEKVIAKKVYEHHINVWNGFNELAPPKKNKEEFYQSFHNLLKSFKNNSYQYSRSSIYLDKKGKLINGAHRTAAAITYNKSLNFKKKSYIQGQSFCSSNYFLNKKDICKKGLRTDYADLMALEYIYLKSNIYMITLFDHGLSKVDIIYEILKNLKINLVYEKNIELSKNGILNYLITLYYGESWIGNIKDGFIGVHNKYNYCFSNGSRMKVLLVECNNRIECVKAKETIRTMIGKGKHSIHTTDTKIETWRNATTVFNKNTLNFLNQCKIGSFYNNRIKKMIKAAKLIMQLNQVRSEDYCVAGSAILDLYGLRLCADFDILYYPNEKKIKFNSIINTHNNYIEYYENSLEEMIYHPQNYLYFDGIKFSSLDQIFKMKNKRYEEKDLADILMIKANKESLNKKID